MILYHFTDIESLEPILRDGLMLGNLNTSRESTAQPGVTWLTTMDTPKGHGLSFGEPVTDYERMCYRSRYGCDMPANFTHWPDKSRVRIKVMILSSDRNLAHWIRWHGKRTEDHFLDLAKIADATRKSSRSWYLYFGTITPDRFIEVLVDGEPCDGMLKEAA